MSITPRVLRTIARRVPIAREIDFLVSPPEWPSSLPKPHTAARLGADYDTAWARKPLANLVRRGMIATLTHPVVRLFATPTTLGLDRLRGVEGPVIFVANHSSHLDTSLLLTVIPAQFRHRLAVTAGADYPLFFKSRTRSAIWALWLNVIPIDRHKASRRSIEFTKSILDDGWSLLIFPEGTRGEDDFQLEFKPGAAYLAIKSGVPVIPIHLEGTRRIFAPYRARVNPGRTRVTFGAAMFPLDGEKPQDFNERIAAVVAALADEGRTDWWSARRRAANGTTPPLAAPAEMTGWRRAWAGSKRNGRRSKTSWPL